MTIPKSRHRQVQRELLLRERGFASYSEYLSSPRWKRIRAEYFAAENLPKDCMCGATEDLQLHHLTYERVARERLEDLTPLCQPCHQMVHVLERRGDIGLNLRGFVDERRAQRNRAARMDVANAPRIDEAHVMAIVEDLAWTARVIARDLVGPAKRDLNKAGARLSWAGNRMWNQGRIYRDGVEEAA